MKVNGSHPKRKGLLKSTRARRRLIKRAEGLAGLRRSIDARVVDMILSVLSPEQQELLRATAGNPHLDEHLVRLIAVLGGVEDLLGARATGTSIQALDMFKRAG